MNQRLDMKTIKKLLPLAILLTVIFGACQKDKAVGPYADSVVCGIRNPAQRIPWLRTRIEQLKVDVVTVATYKGETYINLYAYYWSCMGCHVYRCDGSSVDFSQLSPTDQQEIRSRLWSKEPVVIYKRSQ